MYFIGGYCQKNVVKGGEVGCRGLRKKIKMGDGHRAEVGAYKEGGLINICVVSKTFYTLW